MFSIAESFCIVVSSISILELLYDFSLNFMEATNIRGVNSGVDGKMYNEELQYFLPFAKGRFTHSMPFPCHAVR